jgi:LemA protein
MRGLRLTLAGMLTLLLVGCGYNRLQSSDEQIKASWSEVLNQYQRRADLVPNLVSTVKGFAAQEQKVLLGVTEARAKVGTIQATPELVNDPQAFQKFEQAQGQLSQALKSLIAVTENYPQLKSDQNVMQLQEQLTTTENQIAFTRQAYNDAVLALNTRTEKFPGNIIATNFGFHGAEYFKGAPEDQAVPKFDLGLTPRA